VPESRVLPGPERRHLDRLTEHGVIAQHARGDVPDLAHGFCTDDVARAIEVDIAHAAVLGWDAITPSLHRSLRFLDEALIPATGRFRNVRDAHGSWLDEGSEDGYGRAMGALSQAARSAGSEADRTLAAGLWQAASPSLSTLTSLRAIASATIACAGWGIEPGSDVDLAGPRLLDELERRFSSATGAEWPWPEAVATYAVALPIEALIRGGRHFGRSATVDLGLRVLDWACGPMTQGDGHLSFIGNDGWWPRHGHRARYDQQPIEAVSTALACQAALEVTGQPRYADLIEAAYAWFLGSNDSATPMADLGSGAGYDGLTADGRNGNQGAESTLAWLLTVEITRDLRSAGR
jgi:hypothetical protein